MTTTAMDSFAPIDEMGIEDIVALSSGANGSAHISLFQNQVSEVPEPRTYALMIVGFALIGAFRFRGRGSSFASAR